MKMKVKMVTKLKVKMETRTKQRSVDPRCRQGGTGRRMNTPKGHKRRWRQRRRGNRCFIHDRKQERTNA